MTNRHLIAILVLLLALAGCGGGSTGASTAVGTQAADLVAADVVALISVNTDQDGDQWQQADELLSRFPGRAKLLGQVRDELRQEGVEWEELRAALGPEVDIAVSMQSGEDEPEVVALVKPDDVEKLKALVAKDKSGTPAVYREVEDGWWAISDKSASLDRVLAAPAAPKLAAQPSFQTASDDQAEESLVEAYVNGPRIRELAPASLRGGLGSVPGLASLGGLVASIQAVDDGLKLRGVARGVDQKATKTFESTFLDEVPTGALLFATFNGGSATANLTQLRQSMGGALAQFEAQLGVKLEDVQQLLAGEVAIYVRPAALIPEVTLVATTDDEARAKRTLDVLASKLSALGVGGTQRKLEEGGLTYTQIPIGGFNLSYAVGNGRIVITDLPSGAAKLGTGDSLADDDDFKAAAEAAGMEEKTTGLLYVNVADSLSILDALADEQVPADVRANLRPLRTLLLFGSQDGDKATVGGFLGIGQ